MAREKPIKLYRRIGGAAGAPDSLLEGEPGFNDNGITLYIGGAGGGIVHPLVGANRQVEIAGAQTIIGVKTIAVTNLRITGGTANGQLLSLSNNATGELGFITPSVGVGVDGGVF